MAIKRSVKDSPEEIIKSMEVLSEVFDMFRGMSDGVSKIKQYRKMAEKTLRNLDHGFAKILNSDETETVRWAGRMKFCVQMLYEIDRNLAFAGKPQFDWAKVIGAITFLEVHIKASESTLELNYAIRERGTRV